jgi:predicted site-specific integrase-resolvase
MTKGKLITLKKWAERLDPSPHSNTLLNWAHDGKIVPIPVKLGRSYYVSENALHIQEVLNGSTITLS